MDAIYLRIRCLQGSNSISCLWHCLHRRLAGLSIKYEVAQKQVISAQRAAPIKQAASSAEPEAPKPSAGELAVGEMV
eukprot:scaffold296141_cov18-Tisochrysis_lutea.AAC.2